MRVEAVRSVIAALGFTMASEPKTGALLAALAASKPGGRCWSSERTASARPGCYRAWTATHGSTPSTSMSSVMAVARRHLVVRSAGDVSRRRTEPSSSASSPKHSLRSHLRRRVAGEVHASRRDVVASDASAVSTSSTICCPNRTGRTDTRRRCPALIEAHRAASRVRDREAVRGLRPDDGRRRVELHGSPAVTAAAP